MQRGKHIQVAHFHSRNTRIVMKTRILSQIVFLIQREKVYLFFRQKISPIASYDEIINMRCNDDVHAF